MADAAVTFLLENLTELIRREVDLLGGTKEKIELVEEEIRSIAVQLQALPQDDQRTAGCLRSTREVIYRAEDVIERYAKNAAERNTATLFKKPLYATKVRKLSKELELVLDEIKSAGQQLRQINETNLQDQDAAAVSGGNSVVDQHQSGGGQETLPEQLTTDHGINATVPSHLKQCINHFFLFPPNSEVPARRLKVLWVAEGLVRKDETETDEYVAERYLHELIDLNLVKITKRKLNGKVKACQLSEEARDNWLPKPEESFFFKDEKGSTLRLVDHHHHHNNNNGFSPDSLQQYRKVISFLSFDTQEGRRSGERIGKFVDKCIVSDCFLELRILDLERVFRPKLPKSVSKLIRLRYIGLRWTFLEQLPEFVNKLLNLQLLDVKHTYISTLPRSIWSMQFLRHLYLSETYRTRFIDRPISPTSSLSRLLTLWGAFVDESTCVVQGLDTILQIRKLGLACRSTSISDQPSITMKEQLKAVDRWISNLRHLETLRLKSRDKYGNPSNLYLSSLTNLDKLSTVYLLGKLQPSVVAGFPLNLTDITLSSSELNADPMVTLEKLPYLVILRLLAKSVLCGRMCSTRGGFPQLKVLKLWKLECLKIWDVEEGAMPCLEDLEIRSCAYLEMLPNGLKHVTELKIKLTLMPEDFIVNTEKTQPELWAKIVPFDEL